MQILDALERRFGKYSINNLTYCLIAGQILVYVFLVLNPGYYYKFLLIGQFVLHGEWWRLITFLFIPISLSPLFAAFSWYFYYLIGTSLENQWGKFRYLVYISMVFSATVLLAFILPVQPLTNTFIYSSVFLAFAYLNPNFTILIFFVLPVKIKWLATLTWIGITWTLLTAPISSKITAVISVANFLLFFGDDLVTALRLKSHHYSHETKSHLAGTQIYHICAVCKRNEVKDPDMKILYCNECSPSTCYCENHISQHQHKLTN